MKYIIAGGRNFKNYSMLKRACDALFEKHPVTEIVSGAAKGADSLGQIYAIEKGIPLKNYPAEWDKYGKSAGYRRNEVMRDYADALIAFWDGQSKGTKHMIEIMQKVNKPVYVVRY